MPWTIIVASSQEDQLDVLLQGAEQIAKKIKSEGDSNFVTDAASVEEVKRKRQRRRDGGPQLLIMTASLRNDQLNPDCRALPGLELVKSVAQEPDPPACILVSDQPEHYDVVQEMPRCEWLYVSSSTDYVKKCLQLARKLRVIPLDPISQPQGDARVDEKTVPATILSVASPSIANSPVPNPPASFRVEPSAKSEQQSDASKKYGLIEVGLPSKAVFATVSLQIRTAYGELIEEYLPQMLELDQATVDDLIIDSRNLKTKLEEGLDWEVAYRTLGERVGQLFWHIPCFSLLYGIAHAQGEGNVRLRFNLERSQFDGLWESIFERALDPDGRFLMLNNTVTRRAHQSSVRNTFCQGTDRIVTDRRDLNVLVIRSDVPNGSVPDGPNDSLWRQYAESMKETGGLSELPCLDDEARVLRRLRARKGTRVTVDVLEPPKGQNKSWSLAALVQRRLKDGPRRYDIVHFAGHALFDDKAKNGDGRGYLVFSGYPSPRAVTIAEVATWLEDSGVQLVYLGCCRSSAAPAALELARNNVPMTIGFSWDLDDNKAVDFAKYFYDALLGNDLKVCVAMRLARRELFNHYSIGDPIWASPVLVAQPKDWTHVEAVLRPRSETRRPSSPPPPRMSMLPPPVTGVEPSVPLHP
jgi:CHAT domain